MTVVAEKMFHVLECIASDDLDEVGLARLTDRTNIPKATLYRLLCDLSKAGIIDHGPSGYSLGTQLFELGYAVPPYKRLRRAATRPMEKLHLATSETVHLSVLHRNHVVVLDKIHGRCRVRIPTSVGARLPLHSTAMGKVALAFSPADAALERVLGSQLRPFTPATVCAPGLLEKQIGRARAAGWATAVEETINGVGCVAAPIVLDGKLLGMVSLSGDPRTRGSLVEQVCSTAKQIANRVRELETL